MSGTFDEEGKGSGSTGKRPVPTIEGTATEVSVEPGAEESQDERASGTENDIATSDVSSTADDDSSVDEREPSETEAEPVESKPIDESRGDDRSLVSRLMAWFAALLTHAIAGLAGGLAVLVALSWGYLPIGDPQDGSALSDIKSRIAALESPTKTAENTAALDGLKSRLATLETASKDQKTQAVDPSDVKALSTQVAQLQASLTSMAEATKTGSSAADAAAISQQVAEVEQRLDKQIQSKIQSEVQTAMAQGGAGAADSGAINALKSEVSDLNAKLKALTTATMDGTEGSTLKPEVSALQRRLNEIEATLPSLLDSVDKENAQTRNANAIIAFSALRDAVNSGRPFATELTTMSALSGDAEPLKALAEHESAGIPTEPMLVSSFTNLLEKARSEDAGDERDFVSRLLGGAESLVKVRRIGEQTDGTGPNAVLARAQTELEAGNLREAVLEVEKLDGPLAKLFGPWMDDALARLDADTVLQQLQEALLVSLADGDGTSHEAETATPDEEIE